MLTDENIVYQTRASDEGWLAGVRTIVLILVAMAMVLVIGWRVWIIMTPPPAVLTENLVSARELILLIDITKSLNDGKRTDTFKQMKDYAVNRVLPNIGPGDKVSCYTVATTFTESVNRVFEKALPLVPEPLLSAAPRQRDGRPPIDVARLWVPVERALSPTGDGWALSINAVRQEQHGHTDYLGAFQYLIERLNSPEHRKAFSETFVLVLGDLIQDPMPKPFEPPPAAETERLAFSGVRVALVVPYRSKEAPRTKGREEVRDYWQKWFAGRGANNLQFATLATTPIPFPASPVPRSLQSQAAQSTR
jgi:hypothetical protein